MNKTIRIESILLVIIYITAFFPFLGIIRMDLLSGIYIFIHLSLNLLLLLLLFLFRKDHLLKSDNLILIILFILTICSLVTNNNTLGSVLTFILIILNFMSFRIIKWDNKSLRFFVILIIPSLVIINLTQNTNLNTNSIGQIYFISMIFMVIGVLVNQKKYKLIYFLAILFCIVEIWHSDSRTTIIAVFITFLMLFLPKKLIQFKCIYRIIYGSVLMIPLIVPYVYTKMYKQGIIVNLFNNVEKNFYSGRQNIWLEFYSLMENNYLLGLGADIQLKSFSSLNLHNSYFTIIFVYGIVFFILYIVYLIICFEQMRTVILKDNVSKVCFSGIIAMIFISTFETILVWTYTSLFIGIFIAVILNRKLINGVDK